MKYSKKCLLGFIIALCSVACFTACKVRYNDSSSSSLGGSSIESGDSSVGDSSNEPITYTITYHLGELENDTDVQITAKTQTVEYGQTLQLYTPSRLGYTFLYWTEEGETQPFTDTSYLREENLTLVAQWEVETYTITYNLGELEYDVDTLITARKQTVTHGQALQLYTPSRVGYTFLYWVINGETQPFTAEEYPFYSGVTLVAQWDKNPYTITYHLGIFENDINVEFGDKKQTVVYSEEFTLATPKYLGYDFLGWTVEGETQPFTDKKYYRTSNITLVASWQQTKYTITYHLGELENDMLAQLSTKKQTLVHGDAIQLATVSREGYKFLYWRHSKQTVEFTATQFDYYENITLVAVWEKETYTITYDFGVLEGNANVSITAKQQQITYGASINLYVATHPDYRLEYWTLEGETDAFDLTQYTIARDITLVAVWSDYTGFH